ncbi:MAG: hypothetical protein J6B43_09515 [Lachnospiraceae bacterium]|nr:hypothetical protein [Lachnospiraceae bacterium]
MSKRTGSEKRGRIDVLDLVKEVIFFLFATVGCFGYVMLMLLIICCGAVAYLPLTIERMLIIAAVCSVLMDIWYIVKTVKKYRK